MSFTDPPKILIVDDSKTIRAQVSRILRDSGYQALCATDGLEALESVRSNAPDLIVLDVNMPNLDGFGVCERLHQMDPPLGQTPIIFLTSENNNVLRLLGASMGAYLQKPIQKDPLLKCVREILETVKL